jgi:DNA sulfur modification protein DndD
VQAVLSDYHTALLEKKVLELQDAVSTSFNTLCRKKDSLRRVAIDPKDFSVTLYDKQGRPLPKSQLAAGEKQIYAVSMLWALGKISGRPLPIMIDTPLARLDSDHRNLLVKEYFPAASHQVIIFSTDTEIDQTYFSQLKRAVTQAYSLEFDPAEYSTKISKGYWWSGNDETH